MTERSNPSPEELWRPPKKDYPPPIEHERRKRWSGTRAMENEIYRSATRDIAHDGEWWDERVAKPLVGDEGDSVPLSDPTGEFGDCEPNEPDKPDENERRARIADLAKQIESTGTVSEKPEGD